jgi:formiminotetrahydrofolate cyclodeaminase
MSDESSSDQQVQMATSTKYTVDDLTAMAANLKIGKRPKKEVDVEMPKMSEKSKGIRKTQCKRLKKQLGF